MSRKSVITLMHALILVFTWLMVGPAFAAAPDFPALTGRVVDEAGILSAQAEAEIVAQLAAHQQSTSNQIVVVTLKSLRGYEISDYGVQLGRHWGIGQKGRNNGALLIVAPIERKMRIEVGYGLEGVLTDAVSRDIIERVIKPPFRQQNYEQGLRAGVGAILAALGGEYAAAPPPATTAEEPDWLFFLPFVFFIAFVARGFFARRAGQQRPLGTRLLTSSVLGGIFGVVAWVFLSSVVVALVVGFVIFVLTLLPRGASYPGGPSAGGWGTSSGGGDSFSGGGGSFGGGGASGDW